MKAQELYDLRESTEFCSGTDLHAFFEQETGEGSPGGDVEVDDVQATRFVAESVETIRHNSPSVGDELLSDVLQW